MKFATALGFLALLACAGEAYACKCSAALLNDLRANPESARTALLGRVESRDREFGLRVERAWTPFTSYVPFGPAGGCNLRHPAGAEKEVLLLLSSVSGKDRGARPDACNSVFVREKDIAPFARKLAPLWSADQGGGAANPSWYLCQQASDCVKARAVCGGFESVNQGFREAHAAWVKSTAPRINCSSPGPSDPSLRAECEGSACLLK